MNAAVATLAEAGAAPRGVWSSAWLRFRGDRVGMASLAIVAGYGLLIALAAIGVVGADWQREVALSNAPPGWIAAPTSTSPARAEAAASAAPAVTLPEVDLSAVDPLAPRYAEWAQRTAQLRTTTPQPAASLPLGADRLGRDVLAKAAQGTRVSVGVGVLAALLATLIGSVLGAVGGYFGRRVGDAIEWLYNVFTSIPEILLIFAFAAVFGRGIGTIVLILGCAGWTGVYRQVRAEFMRHRSRDYVRAAQAIGASDAARMFRHILPNAAHVILVRLSLLVVGFIKAEVILSYLGLGVPVDQVSWGTMLAESQSELVQGYWWQLAAATAFMALFVTAFSLAADAMRDALDPKLRGLE